MPKQKQHQSRQQSQQQQECQYDQVQQAQKPVAGANARKSNKPNYRNNNCQEFIYVAKSTILKNLLENETEQERRVKEIEDSIRSELMQREKEQKVLDEKNQRREELEMKKERDEADERLRKMEIIRYQKEEEERKRLESEKASKLERARAEKEVGETLDQMIGKMEAIAEKRMADLKYLKSREGLLFLLESDFADFSDQISADLPPSLFDFASRNYVISQAFSAPQSSNYRKKQSSFSNKESQRHHNNNQFKSHREPQVIYTKKDNGIPRIDKLTKEEEDEASIQLWRGQQAQRYSLQKDELKFFLNVLTPDNFDNLKEQFFSLCQVDASKCIHQLINKVCKESKYTKLYSQLAIYVREREEKQTADKQLSQQGNEKSEQLSSFRSQMLYMLSDLFYDQSKLKKLLKGSNSVQEHSPLSNDTSVEKSTSESQDNKRFQTFLKFLGELFTAKFLPKKIISYCIQTMMQQFVQNGLQEEDRNIEGIVSLIDSIGPDFEAAWKNPSSKQAKLDLEFLNQVRSQYSNGTKKTAFDSGFFEKEFISFRGVMNFLAALNTAHRVSVMLSSLIVNLTHRWENGWEKALHQKENPRTLKELHQQHYEELNQRQVEVEQDLRSNRNGRNQQFVPIQIQLKPKEINNITNNFQQKIKQILSDLDSNQSDPIDCIHQIEKLRQQNPADTYKHLLTQFFNTRLDNLSRRCSLVKDFLINYSRKDTKILISSLNSIFNSMFSQACDFPHIYESFALITCPLIAKGLFSFSDFSQLPCDDADDADDKSYFFQELQSHFSAKQKAI